MGVSLTKPTQTPFVSPAKYSHRNLPYGANLKKKKKTIRIEPKVKNLLAQFIHNLAVTLSAITDTLANALLLYKPRYSPPSHRLDHHSLPHPHLPSPSCVSPWETGNVSISCLETVPGVLAHP